MIVSLAYKSRKMVNLCLMSISIPPPPPTYLQQLLNRFESQSHSADVKQSFEEQATKHGGAIIKMYRTGLSQHAFFDRERAGPHLRSLATSKEPTARILRVAGGKTSSRCICQK
jgi:hypothetical protein